MSEWRTVLEARCAAAALSREVCEAVEREIAEHLQDRYDDLVQRGSTPDAAARLVAGEVPAVPEIRRLARSRSSPVAPAPVPPLPRDATGDGRAGHIWRDLTYACRVFARDRTFSGAAILTLALCVAANVAVFAMVDAILLEAVDAPQPEALVHVGNFYPNAGAAAATVGNAAVPDYFDRRVSVPALAEQALFRSHGVSVGDQEAERLLAMTTTPTLFPLLRATAALGRTFVDEEGEVGRNRVVILSDALWRRLFGAAPDVLGRSLVVGGVPHAIVGVMPPGFRFYDDQVVLWLPAAFSEEERSDDARHSNNWTHVGRLAATATLSQAQAQVDALNAANLDRFPALRQPLLDAGFRSVCRRLADVLTVEARRPLYLLWSGVACVLLIGVVNVAALTLARATARRGELATRIALGAAPGRVRAQLLTEHLAFAVVGGGLGVALGWTLVRLLPTLGVAAAPPGRPIELTPLVWAYAAIVTLVVGCALGLTAIRSISTDTAATLRDDGRSRSGSRTTRHLRQGLVVFQVAVACVLLVAAGALLTSFRRLLDTDTGFRTSVVTGAVSLPAQAYPTDAARLAFYERLLDRLRALPGVTAAGATTVIPFGGASSDSVVWPADRPATGERTVVSPDQITVSPGYFEAMGMPMVAGRAFDGTERDGTPLVAIVDERLAARFWPGRDAVGRELVQPLAPEALTQPTPQNTRTFRIVGVVRTIKQASLITPTDAVGTYYFAAAQDVPPAVVLAIDGTAKASEMESAMRRAVAELDPRVPLFDRRVMQDRVDGSLSTRRATMALAVAFGGLALVLAAVGLYGVLAYLVAQRSREIGIRIALGGAPPAIAGLVLRESLSVVGVGLLLGLAGAAWLGRAIASELVEVRVLDPPTLTAACGLLLVAALAATAAPARRAIKVDPAVTLTSE